MYQDSVADPRAGAQVCPFCGVDLEQHIVCLGEQVFVCEVCMHEVPGPVPGQRRSGTPRWAQSSSTEKSQTASTLPS
ncbi:MAG TPA: hypothetical protein VHU88_17800 [Sporichthyaceae bacterium]|jgi:hypothetical protein|nr:hypothetical protein [Sporichthyaceae bacterium]